MNNFEICLRFYMDVGGIQNALTTVQKLFYKQLFRNALEVIIQYNG